MSQDTLLVVFVALAAVALLGQAIALIGLLFIARDIRNKTMALWPQIESIVAVSKRSVDRVETHIARIGATSVAILDATKQQLVKVDELLSDASTRARVQLSAPRWCSTIP